MVKFRVTETIAQTYLDGEGDLPFDLTGLATPGTDATPRVKQISSGSSVVLPPYNILPPAIAGTPDVGQTLSAVDDAWAGAGAFEYEWLVDGAVSATTATLLVTVGMRGATITLRKRAAAVNGSEPSAWITATNSLFIPATSGDGVLLPEEYGFSEAVADVDTRKTYAVISDTPPAGYEWIIYRGTNPAGDLATVAVPTLDGANWVWTSTGTATVGTGPDGRTPVYVRIGLRETAVPTNKYFVTPTGEYFLASSIPGAPTISLATGAGQGEIDITLTNGSDGAGRTLTRYEYQLDTGSWLTLPGGTALGLRTINTGNPTTTYVVKVRAVNVNGNGIATAGESATSGTTTVVPAQVASDAWTVTDKPSTLGNTVTLSYTGSLPADGGAAITALGYKLNGGSFVSLGLTLPVTVDVTVPATTLATFDVQAQNSVGFSVASTKTVTPTTIAALAATAEFGALTPALAGGWRPTTALGDEIELVAPIVSQTGCTRTWSIVDGALVANGTPDVDNTKTVVVTTVLGGNVSATISSVAGSWSARTGPEMAAALSYSPTLALDILIRPVTIDIETGSGQFFPSTGVRTKGWFYQRVYNLAPSHRKVTKHPGQVKRWRAIGTSHVNYTKKLWLDEVDFWVDSGTREHLVIQSNGCDQLKITNFSCKAPDIDAAVLNDPNPWATIPTVPLTRGFSLQQTTVTNLWLENGVFENCYQAGDYSTAGTARFINLEVNKFYFDGLRFFATGDWTPKLFKNIKIYNCFAKYEELGNNNPHSDSIQVMKLTGGGNLRSAVFTNIEVFRGAYRATQVSGYQGTETTANTTFWNWVDNSSEWNGISCAGSDLVIGNAVLQNTEGSGSHYVRIGVPENAAFQAKGEILIYNSAAVQATGTAFSINQNGGTVDFVTPTISGCVDANGASDLVPYFNDVYMRANTPAELRTKFTAKPGQIVGPLDEAGAWRSEDYPPLCTKPVVANAGADLLITPGTSPLYHALPTVWDYKYRNADGVNNWTKVEGLTGTSATLVAPTKTAIQVKARWKNAAGIPGPWSETQTVIV